MGQPNQELNPFKSSRGVSIHGSAPPPFFGPGILLGVMNRDFDSLALARKTIRALHEVKP